MPAPDADAKSSPDRDGNRWPRTLARYREPRRNRSTVELVVTVVPLVTLWAMMWETLRIGPALCLLLSIPAAGFLMRLFMIQHDCGHGSFFRGRALNDWVGASSASSPSRHTMCGNAHTRSTMQASVT